MRRAFLALLVVSVVSAAGCALAQRVSRPPREYYMTERPYTFANDRADSAIARLPDRVLFEINDMIRVSRQYHREEVACFPVRFGSGQYWIGDLYPAAAVKRTLRTMIDSFECDKGDGVVHTHWTAMDGDCAVAGPDLDASKATLGVPVWLVSCGYGMDSLIAYRVKPDGTVATRRRPQPP